MMLTLLSCYADRLLFGIMYSIEEHTKCVCVRVLALLVRFGLESGSDDSSKGQHGLLSICLSVPRLGT